MTPPADFQMVVPDDTTHLVALARAYTAAIGAERAAPDVVIEVVTDAGAALLSYVHGHWRPA